MKQLALTLLAVIIGSLFVACSDDDDNNVDTEFVATQSDLNAATNSIMTNVTGGGFSHGGTDPEGNDTYRDIFSNRTDLSSLPKGTIIAKKTHARLDGDVKGDLMIAFAMVKREAGYDPDNQDWEWMKMPFDADNNYDTNPFGVIPDVSDTENRGKLAGCIGCHNGAPGGDFTWAND